jgi:AraC-like DNA-binding protein
MNSTHFFEPHLVIRHINLPPASEWKPQTPGWLFALVTSGQAYAMHGARNQQLDPGSVVVLPCFEKGYILTSQLNWALLHFFQVEPERLVGLFTLPEQQRLKELVRRNNSPPRVFPARHSLSERFKKLCVAPGSSLFSLRLELLSIFVEIIGEDWKSTPEEKLGVSTTNARARMSELLKQMPTAALLDLSLNELVKHLQCTPRHINRLFNEVVGMSFRQKQSEIRLLRARELLATTDSKVLEVAMESGFQTVSLFNLMFKRRFGLTPGKWRERARTDNSAKRVRELRLTLKS